MYRRAVSRATVLRYGNRPAYSALAEFCSRRTGLTHRFANAPFVTFNLEPLTFNFQLLSMRLNDFNYVLPQELIAQRPLERRDQSRLLVADRARQAIEHRTFLDILDYLRDDDLMIFNDTRVSAARLYGRKETGGKVEALLDEAAADRALARNGQAGQACHGGDEADLR